MRKQTIKSYKLIEGEKFAISAKPYFLQNDGNIQKKYQNIFSEKDEEKDEKKDKNDFKIFSIKKAADVFKKNFSTSKLHHLRDIIYNAPNLKTLEYELYLYRFKLTATQQEILDNFFKFFKFAASAEYKDNYLPTYKNENIPNTDVRHFNNILDILELILDV